MRPTPPARGTPARPHGPEVGTPTPPVRPRLLLPVAALLVPVAPPRGSGAGGGALRPPPGFWERWAQPRGDPGLGRGQRWPPGTPPGASPRRAGTRRVPSVVQEGAAQGLLCSEVTGKGIKSLKAEGERGTGLTAAPQLAQGTCKELGVPRAQGRHGSGATTGCPLLRGRRLGGHLPGNASQKNIKFKKNKGEGGLKGLSCMLSFERAGSLLLGHGEEKEEKKGPGAGRAHGGSRGAQPLEPPCSPPAPDPAAGRLSNRAHVELQCPSPPRL